MPKENKQQTIMELAGQFYEGLSEKDIEEIERIALDRSNFFGERTTKIQAILEGIEDDDIHEEFNFGEIVEKK